MPFGVDFGGSKSSSSSQSYVDPRQQPYLDFLRNTGMGMLQGFGGAPQQFAQGAGQQLYGMGNQFLGGLMGNPFLAGLAQQAGGNQGLIDRQVNQLGADIGQQFNQQILPGISRQYQGIGGLGGSRMGVSQGIAAQGAADALSRGITDIYTADSMRSLQAGSTGAGIFSQGLLGGLAAMPGLFDLGMAQFTGGLAPLLAYNQIVGPPTVLDKSKSSSFSINGGFGGSA